ncbi:MAG: ribosome biogenesis GTPase Der [Anaerofustis stercorihominis]|nr:ribosome biogenesis GTPase Der [Anaerofustis stercorihominis]
MSKAYVALVGRPNTGKSTLFNRLAGSRISIVENTPGVTRDRIISEAQWLDSSFYLIDTGGIEPENEDIILIQMRRQAELAMEMADVIVLICDGRHGIHPADRDIAEMIRKSNTPCVVAVNKIDDYDSFAAAYEFYELGLGEPISISAEHGRGLGDLLDEVIANFPDEKVQQELDNRSKIAVIGKPNAGKSTLVNTLLGEERVIVSNIAGTTRDAIDTLFDYEDMKFTLIDTAGIKKKKRSYDNIEYYSNLRAMQAIERSDICLLMIDASIPITEQDVKVAAMAHEANKAIVIVMNKWDLVAKETNTMNEIQKQVRSKLHFIDHAPIVFLSAIDGKRTEKLMPKVIEVLSEYEKRVNTGLVNEVIANAISMNTTPSKGGKHMKVFYASQVQAKPPTFALFVNDPELATPSYNRYIVGKLRDAFGFNGCPIKLVYRARNNKE